MSPLVFAMALAIPIPATAQSTAATGSLWVGGSIGLGFVGASCPVCVRDRRDAASASVRVGTVVSGAVRLGVEATGWTRGEGGVDFRFGALTAVAMIDPARDGRGWYLKTGIGAVTYRVTDADNPAITATGAAGQFEVGHQVPVGARLSFHPFAGFTGSVGASFVSDNQSLTPVGLTLIQIGLGVTYR